ncbi:MAG: site-2 protease family protein [Leptolyngbyaceae bacterium]|nr:site-2 protease family protein [Leptolyngbyaceae bacterium]
MIVWLLLLGLITYFIVQRSVAGLTRTPVWILWLVMMTPAFVWSAWTLVYGEKTPMPLALVLGPFVVCFQLYWFLVQRGRQDSPSTPGNAAESPKQPSTVNSQATGTQTENQSAETRLLDKTEEANLQNCFPWSVYYLQKVEQRLQAVVCRGQLRSTPEVAYKTIRENIEARFGDRFLVIFQEGFNSKPFFALVPNPQAQTSGQASDQVPGQSKSKSDPLNRPLVALGLLVATVFTTTVAGIELAGVSAEALRANSNLWLTGLPYALSLVTILGVHELGHYFTARFYKMRAALPYFIPVPFFLGTFGAFTQIRSPVPNRKALFDLSISGPLAGLVVTLPLLMVGLALSQVVPLPAKATSLDFNAFNPSVSLLVMLLSKVVLGGALTLDSAIKLHPVAIAGCLGLIVTALNLMPVGQLDGGRIVHAMFGQRTGAAIGQVSRLLVLALSLVQPELLIWAILLFFMPILNEPTLNDVSELDNQRDLWGLLVLGLLLVIILPAPRFLTQVLL